jgi:hypothetical protein
MRHVPVFADRQKLGRHPFSFEQMVPLLSLHQLVAGRRAEPVVGARVQVGQRLQDVFPRQATGDGLRHGPVLSRMGAEDRLIGPGGEIKKKRGPRQAKLASLANQQGWR